MTVVQICNHKPTITDSQQLLLSLHASTVSLDGFILSLCSSCILTLMRIPIPKVMRNPIPKVMRIPIPKMMRFHADPGSATMMLVNHSY